MLTRKSFAKINLYLEITGKTANNYHTLDSLMAPLDLCDVITIEKSDKLQLVVKGKNEKYFNDNWQENIIIKAVNLLALNYKFDPKIKITLEKNIPVAAGLGGGSSNGATILLMLNQFYNLNLSDVELEKIGLQLGADVPFCLNGKIAFVYGIGEIVKPVRIETNDLFILLVNPNQHLSTKQVYENSTPDKNYFIQQNKGDNLLNLIQNRRNDLQKPAIKIMPIIGEIIEKISEQRGCKISRMSGSGATCFGIFANEEDLNLASQNLQNTFPGFYLQKVKIV